MHPSTWKAMIFSLRTETFEYSGLYYKELTLVPIFLLTKIFYFLRYNINNDDEGMTKR